MRIVELDLIQVLTYQLKKKTLKPLGKFVHKMAVDNT